MIYALLSLTFGVAASALISLFLYTYVINKLALKKFKKLSKGLPLAPELWPWWGNHVISWPFRKDLAKKMLQGHLETGHKTIGYLFRHHPGVSTIDLDLMKKIVYDEGEVHVNRSSAVGLPLHEYDESIMLATDNDWRRMRRYIAPAFKPTKFRAPNVVREIEVSIKKLTDKIDKDLEKRAIELGDRERAHREGREFMMEELAHKYSLDLVFGCLYKQHDLINFDAENETWTHTVREGLKAAMDNPLIKLSQMFPMLRRLLDWLIWHFHPQGAWRQAIMNFVKMQALMGMKARKQARELKVKCESKGERFDPDNFTMEDGTKFRRNMIDTVIDYYLDGKLSRKDFLNNGCFMVAAADRTSADTFMYTTYFLALHQHIQDKLRAAVLAEGADSEYLSWVINESMRILPPAPIGCSRTVKHDIELESGHVIPADTLVIMSPHLVHHLKEYWGEDADEFKPERWRHASSFHPMQFIPFGAGQRVCAGKEFALFELRMLFAKLIARYRFECGPMGDVLDFQTPGLILHISNPNIKLTIKKLDY